MPLWRLTDVTYKRSASMRRLFRSLLPSRSRRSSTAQQKKKYRNCRLEPLERRELLTASSLANGVGTNIEYTGPYSNYMPVGSGPSSYSGYSSFGNIDVPASAFALGSGASQVNSLSLNLYNTATSGTYAPTAGSFRRVLRAQRYDSTSCMRFGGPSGTQAGTQTGLAAIGTTTGGASTLGIGSSDLVGTFSITSALPLGLQQLHV